MTDNYIGIVGVGLMGHGIATNIQKNGWSIGFYEHEGNQPVDNLIKNGATAYQSLATLAADCDVIILCVTGSPQVDNVLTHSDGILAGITEGTVIIDCSTAIPASTQKLATLVHDKGGKFLDAPMTRLPKDAAEGKLNLIVGGEKTLFDQMQPLLKSYAENITYAGGVGMGHTMKLLHNYVSLGFAAVLAEATAAADHAGVNAEVLQQVLAAGGGASVVLDRMTPFMLQKEVGGFAFTLANSAKDLGYYTQMCSELNAQANIAHSINETFSEQVAQGNGDAFVPYLIDFLVGDQLAN